jgi:putative oligomerization/nucleic acid binding protein/phospholipase D-like protein
MLAATWGTGQVLFDMLWFFLLFIEIWLMITIFIDLFRRHDLRGWVKALWILGILVVPLIGILLYLIVYGNEMKVHAIQASQDQDQAFRDYLRQAGASSSPSEELARLAELRDRGVINDTEFEQLKSRIVQGVG